MRRAAKRRLVLDLDRDRIALLGDAQDPGVARHVDVVGKEKLERRLGDEIFVLRIELVVDDGDAAAVGDDLEARRVGVLEQHAAWARDAQRSLRALSVRSDLNEVGGHDARRVQPGVGARHRFGGGERRRGGGLRRLWRIFPPAHGAGSADPARRRPGQRRERPRGQAQTNESVSPRSQNPCRLSPAPPNRRSPHAPMMGDIPSGRKRRFSREPCAPSVAGSRPSRGYRTPARAASSDEPRRSTIASTCAASTMKGGASRTWSPATPSIVPPIG